MKPVLCKRVAFAEHLRPLPPKPLLNKRLLVENIQMYAVGRGERVQQIKLSKLELQIMDVLWDRKEASIRDLQEGFPEGSRPAYATVQTTVYRLEAKGAVHRVRKVGHFHIFEAVVTRTATQHRLLEDLLAFFGGQTRPMVAQLVDSGKLTLDDVKFAEKLLKDTQTKGRGK